MKFNFFKFKKLYTISFSNTITGRREKYVGGLQFTEQEAIEEITLLEEQEKEKIIKEREDFKKHRVFIQ